jgi:hypothetical protein
MNKEQAIKIIEAYVSGDISENELYIKEAIECVKGLQEPNKQPKGFLLVKVKPMSKFDTKKLGDDISAGTDAQYNVIVHDGFIEDLKIVNP